MTGTAVLNVRPNTTDMAAARPAVLARRRCEATSPTKAQPSCPTLQCQLVTRKSVRVTARDSRALFPSAQMQTTKMRKSCSGFVWPTWPRTPTSRSVREDETDAAKTTSRRPNRSVARMRPVAVTRERISAAMISRKQGCALACRPARGWR